MFGVQRAIEVRVQVVDLRWSRTLLGRLRRAVNENAKWTGERAGPFGYNILGNGCSDERVGRIPSICENALANLANLGMVGDYGASLRAGQPFR